MKKSKDYDRSNYAAPREVLLIGGPGAGRVVKAYPDGGTHMFVHEGERHIYNIDLLICRDGTRQYVATMRGMEPVQALVKHYIGTKGNTQ